MKSMVLIFGTDHRYQRKSREFTETKHNAFLRRLDSVCNTYSPEAIAEEFSREALTEHGIEKSVPELYSEKNGIVHKYCDPNRKERVDLKISQETDIRASAFFNNWSEEKIQNEVQLSHNRREIYWVDRLLELNRWPVLFICGSDHTESFCNVLCENDIQYEIVENDWSA